MGQNIKLNQSELKIKDTSGFFTYKMNGLFSKGIVEKSPNFVLSFNSNNDNSIDSQIYNNQIQMGWCVDNRIFVLSNSYLYELLTTTTLTNGVSTVNRHYSLALQKTFSITPKIIKIIYSGTEDILVIENKSTVAECVRLSNSAQFNVPLGDDFIFYNDRLFIGKENKIMYSKHYNITNFTLEGDSGGEFYVGYKLGDFIKFNVIGKKLYDLYNNGAVIIDFRGEEEDFNISTYYFPNYYVIDKSVALIKDGFIFSDGKGIIKLDSNGVSEISLLVEGIAEDIFSINEELKYPYKSEEITTLDNAFIIGKNYFLPIYFSGIKYIFCQNLTGYVDTTFPKDESGEGLQSKISEVKQKGYLINSDVFCGSENVAFDKRGKTYKYTNSNCQLNIYTTSDLGEYIDKKIISFIYTANGTGSIVFKANGEQRTYSLKAGKNKINLGLYCKNIFISIYSTDKDFRIGQMSFIYATK